jgi:phage tail sheath protein FI
LGLPAIAEASSVETSALDNVNVRRLLELIKEHLNEAAQAHLFEFNDAELRMAFRNWMEYSLQPYKDSGVIADYKVVCDESNNTPESISRGEFAADLYIKPTKSVSYVQLNTLVTSTNLK